MEILGYFATFFAGLVLGLIGGGGSILAIPILVYLFTMNIVDATAYSLFIVGLTSLVGALQRYKGASLDLNVGLIFGIPSIIAVFITRKWVIPLLPEILFQLGDLVFTKRYFILGLFSLLVVIASVLMITRHRNFDERKAEHNMPALILQGIAVGLITGLVGVGGGFLIVPSLFFLARIPLQTAIGTTLFIIALKSLIGFVGDVMNHPIDWLFLAGLSAISIAGILLGTRFSNQLSTVRLKQTFGWFTLVVGVAIFINETFS